MLRLMRRLIIHMHIGALDIRQRLQLTLQRLGDIMGVAERGLGLHDQINLDHQAGPTMPGAHGVEGQHRVRRVGDGQIGDEL